MKIYIHCSSGDGALALCDPQPTAPQVSRKSFICLMSSSQPEDLCGHCRSLVEEPNLGPLGAAALQEMLAELRGEDFGQRLLTMSEGREIAFLASSSLRKRLSAALQSAGVGARAFVESQLDTLFIAHRQGEVFKDTLVTMGLLYAIKTAKMSGWENVLDVFAQTKAAEFALLRRFAQGLLQRADEPALDLEALPPFPLYASTESGPTWAQLGMGAPPTPEGQGNPLSPAPVPTFPLLHRACATHDLTCALGQLIQAACRYPREKPHLVTERQALDLTNAAVAFTIQLAIEDGHDAVKMRGMEQQLRAFMTPPKPISGLETANIDRCTRSTP